MKDKLFEEFESMSREQWMARIEKELRGKPLDTVFWQLNEDWNMPPFGHPEDAPAEMRAGRKAQESWLIGEELGEDDPARQLQRALKGGVQALAIGAHQLADLQEDLKAGLPAVHYLVVEGNREDGEKALEILRGLDVSAALSAPEPPPAQRWEAFPGLRVLTVDARPQHRENPAAAPEELADLLRRANRLMEQFTDAGLSPEKVNDRLHFRLACGNSFYVEIAKLRALRLLWANVLAGYGVPEPAPIPPVEVRIAPHALVEDPYLNMIRLTTQAMSAVIGGCDLLFLPPADQLAEKKQPSFTRRIARNVQHLLKLESHLDAVQDPAGGSYYLEKWTEEIAERAWKSFTAAA